MTDQPAVRVDRIPPLEDTIVNAVKAVWWPIERVGEAMELLASRLSPLGARVETLRPPLALDLSSEADLSDWLDWAAARHGFEMEPVETGVRDVGDVLFHAAPALVRISLNGERGLLVVVKVAAGRPVLLAADHRQHRVDPELLATALAWPHLAPLLPEIERLTDLAATKDARRWKVRASLMGERLAPHSIDGVWIVRAPATEPFGRQIVRARMPHVLLGVLCVFAGVYALEIGGWGLIGAAALDGRLDFGWMAAWLLLVLTLAPARYAGGALEARFAQTIARLLKTRLLAGALRVDPSEVARMGSGHLLSRVMESQALEALALNGGLAVVVALLELVFAGAVLAGGAAPLMHLALLSVFCGLTALLAFRFHKAVQGWARRRLAMTHDLIEGMIGHRTRLAQEQADRRDAEEDRQLEEYLRSSQSLDSSGVAALAALPSLWVFFAIAGLAPDFMQTPNPSGAAFAISLGGVLLAQRAFAAVSSGVAALSRAGFAWREVADLFHAAQAETPPPRYLTRSEQRAPAGGYALVEAQDLTFAYDADSSPVLRGLDLRIQRGDRILLEGESGGGKSTLTALLAGVRTPTGGALLINGLDRDSLGENWRRLVSSSPQFHENHILSGSLAFNLLMGRSWPPTPDDLADARGLCEDLGLGPLLERMPAGLLQQVGETGWQLSHGERSRIYLARAILQNAELVILDESFAALDPETLDQCMRVARERAPTLLVVAHP